MNTVPPPSSIPTLPAALGDPKVNAKPAGEPTHEQLGGRRRRMNRKSRKSRRNNMRRINRKSRRVNRKNRRVTRRNNRR